MKGKRMLFGMMIVAALLIMAQPSVSSAYMYNEAWTANDEKDSFFVEFTLNPTSTGSFSMYDWRDQSTSVEIFNWTSGSTGITTQTVTFALSGSNWTAAANGTTINLGDKLEFGFSFSNTTTTTYNSYDVTVNSSVSDSYILTHDLFDGVSIITSDVQPAPIPASALLLGSGMVGLIGFGRRRGKKVF